jgi:hypothetical protein
VLDKGNKVHRRRDRFKDRYEGRSRRLVPLRTSAAQSRSLVTSCMLCSGQSESGAFSPSNSFFHTNSPFINCSTFPNHCFIRHCVISFRADSVVRNQFKNTSLRIEFFTQGGSAVQHQNNNF